MTSNCLQKMKRNWIFYTDNKNIFSGYRNRIWDRKMCYAYYQKWEKIDNRRNRTAKSGKDQNTSRKGNLQVLGNIGSGNRETSGDEKKKKPQKTQKQIKKKRVSQTNEKTSWNQTQESHQRNKHLSCPIGKILGTILTMNEKRTRSNGQEEK